MKRILCILMCIIAILVPVCGRAATISFNGYYCDSKQKLDENTFYLICHIVVSSDVEINYISGTLILENVTLESIKTYDDWTSENGLSTEVVFYSESGHSGTFTVADLVYTGDLSAENCEASFMPNKAEYIKPRDEEEEDEPIEYVCMIIDDVYYGIDGTVVTKEDYLEECCDYTCTIIDDKYYFDSNGNSVTYEEFIKDCSDTEINVDVEVSNDINSEVTNPKTGINYGYIMLPLGIVALIVTVKLTKKNTKIYKI